MIPHQIFSLEVPMWKKEGENGTPAGDATGKDGEIIAFVGKSVQFKGAITYEGTVRIDGRVDGEIQTSGMLIVGEEAVITAKVQARSEERRVGKESRSRWSP